MAGRKHLTYEIRSDGRVVSEFSKESEARKELRRLRRDGMTVRIYSIWVGSGKRRIPRRKDGSVPSALWLKDLPDLPVTVDAASNLIGCWGTIDDPFFLGAYRNGVPCDPDSRDSDLSIQPSEDGLRLCYREIPMKRVFIVISPVEYVEIAEDILVLSDGGSDGLPTAVALRISDGNESSHDGYPFKEGWYLLSGGLLLFVWRSDARLSDRQVRTYDRNVLCTAVYPAFGTYEIRKGGFRTGIGTDSGVL